MRDALAIVGGVPARPIKKRFSDDVIARLLASEWWELPADVIRENYAIFNARPDEAGLKKLEALSAAHRSKTS